VRRLVAATALMALASCYLTSGPDCADACEKMVECTQLTGTFRLSCSPVAGTCFGDVATCAECVEDHTCAELVAGACDALCRVAVDGGP